MALPFDADAPRNPLSAPVQLQLPDMSSGGWHSDRRDTTKTVDSIFREASMHVMDAVGKLDNVQAIKLQEQRQLLEAITGIEQNNSYLVTDLGGRELFMVQENSSCVERTCFCCCPDCKPWRMDFFNLPQGYDGTSSVSRGQHFLHLERPFTCLCCCLCRPTALATEPDGTLLGKVREPRTRCSYNYTVQDIAGQHVLNSYAPCCQSGRICRCPGFQVAFPIIDVSEIPVAEVRKTWTKGDCCPCCFKDWNKYTVEFGQSASAEAKLLLVSLAVVVQMRHFDSR